MKKIILYLIFLVFLFINVNAIDYNTSSLEEFIQELDMDMLDAMKILEYRKTKTIGNLDQLVHDKIISYKEGQRIKNVIKMKNPAPVVRMRVNSTEEKNSYGQAKGDNYTDDSVFKTILKSMEDRNYNLAKKYISLFKKRFKDSRYIDDILYFAASILEEENRLDDAAVFYLKIVKSFYTSDISVISLFRAGICYEKMKNNEKAISVYRRIINEFSDTVWAEKSGKRLEALQS